MTDPVDLRLVSSKAKNSAPKGHMGNPMDYESEARAPNRGVAIFLLGAFLGVFWLWVGIFIGWAIWH